MKKYLYSALAVLAVLALIIAGGKYLQEYSFNQNLEELNALGFKADAQNNELTKSIAQSAAYQILYSNEIFEGKFNRGDFLSVYIKKLSQGILDEDEIAADTLEILKNPPAWPSPEDDSAFAHKIISGNISQKMSALNATITSQKNLSSRMIYYLKEKEMPLDAMTWAYIVKTQNIPQDSIASIFSNWPGDEKQNMRLASKVKTLAAKGKARPLTKKEEAKQAFYSKRIAMILNPVLQNKDQIASLSPEKCARLMAGYFADQIKQNNLSLDVLQISLNTWQKDENFKKMFTDKLQEELKNKKISHFTYFEFLQFNTCSAEL